MNATGGLCGIASATCRSLPDAMVLLCVRQAVDELQVVASDTVVLTWPAFFFRIFCMQLALCIELEVLLVFTCSWACASPTAPQP